MLERLEIRNYVLITSLEIDFKGRFGVLTGETGSGKSIILGALSLILGEKVKGEVVRLGANEAVITALFSFSPDSEVATFLDRLEIERDDDSVVIQRVIKANGRSIISVAGRAVSRSTLEELGALLVNISSQHEHQSLLKSDVQLSVLDRFAHDEKTLAAVDKAYSRLSEAGAELKRLQDNEAKLKGELDYMKFCLDELEKADLKAGEDEELSEELKRISSAEALTEGVSAAQSALRGDMEEGVLTLLARSVSMLGKACDRDSSLKTYRDRLEAVMIESEDISESLRDYLSSLTFSEAELEEKSSRLALLQRIRKKYGPTLEAAIERRDLYREQLQAAENSDELIQDAENELKAARSDYEKISDRLHKERIQASRKLSKEVEATLLKLGMKDASFSIELSPSAPSHKGSDCVSFMIAANKGEKLSTISEAASGGELSRIMLALKGVLASSDEVDTLVFDEVDAGIGGAVANAVADELEELSESHQVLCITHLAQIAIRADEHFRVTKSVSGGRTVSHVELIEKAERENEIARLLSGDGSSIALEHARSLLEVQAGK